jgi:hypothetical protein
MAMSDGSRKTFANRPPIVKGRQTSITRFYRWNVRQAGNAGRPVAEDRPRDRKNEDIFSQTPAYPRLPGVPCYPEKA